MRPKQALNKRASVILLTGHNGYVGAVMTKFLRKESFYVIGLDINWFSKNCFFPVPEDSKPNRQIIKDIRDINKEDLKDVDAVIHLAALSNDPLGEINPHLTDIINYKSTVRIAEICKEIGIKRFIFASSCSVYGKTLKGIPINEEGVLKPITSYAKAKVNSEIHMAKLADNNFHPVFMRNATAYGLSPMLRLDIVLNNLVAWGYLTNEITIMSDGTPWRPLVHVEDFCRAFIAVLSAPAEKIHCQAFNVGINHDNYQIEAIACEVQKFLPKVKIRILNKTGPDKRTYRVDFSKIGKILPDFKPQWNLKKGIVELLETYKKHNLTINDFNSGKYFRIDTVKSLIETGKLDENLSLRGGKI